MPEQEEKLTIGDVLNRIRDNAAQARRAMEEMDRYSVLLFNEVNLQAKNVETLKIAYKNLENKLSDNKEE